MNIDIHTNQNKTEKHERGTENGQEGPTEITGILNLEIYINIYIYKKKKRYIYIYIYIYIYTHTFIRCQIHVFNNT